MGRGVLDHSRLGCCCGFLGQAMLEIKRLRQQLRLAKRAAHPDGGASLGCASPSREEGGSVGEALQVASLPGLSPPANCVQQRT